MGRSRFFGASGKNICKHGHYGIKEASVLSENVKIHVENLTKKYGDLLVLDDISFDIQKGEFV